MTGCPYPKMAFGHRCPRKTFDHQCPNKWSDYPYSKRTVVHYRPKERSGCQYRKRTFGHSYPNKRSGYPYPKMTFGPRFPRRTEHYYQSERIGVCKAQQMQLRSSAANKLDSTLRMSQKSHYLLLFGYPFKTLCKLDDAVRYSRCLAGTENLSTLSDFFKYGIGVEDQL
jgi:hypothetical protein